MTGRRRFGGRARWAVGVGALGLALAVGAPGAEAQVDPNLARGMSAVGSYESGGLDSVNLFNGNLILALPLGGSYPVNGGLWYGLSASYNAKVWDLSIREDGSGSYVRADPGKTFNAGLGWSVGLGELVVTSTGGTYTSGDGGEHMFFDRLHLGEPATSGVFFTRDGSYLRLRKIGASDLTYEVEFPDGTIRKFVRATVTAPFKLVEIRDRFGNAVTVSQTTTQWTLSEGQRMQKVVFGLLNGGWVVDRVELTASGTQTAVWDFEYTVATIEEHCADTDPDNDQNGQVSVALLTAVHLPAGAGSYRMDAQSGYYHNCADLSPALDDLPGVLRKLELPTRGSVEWTYQLYVYPQRAPGPPGEPHVDHSQTIGVASKTVRNAAGQCEVWNNVGCTWSYAWENLPPTLTRRTLVTLPTGDVRAHYFNQSVFLSTATWNGWQYGLPIHTGISSGAGYFLSQEVYDGPATGTPVRSIYLGYEKDRLPLDTLDPDLWYNTNRRVQRSKTVFHDDGGNFAAVDFSQFDGLGNYRRRVTGGSFGSADVRTTHTEFNPGQGVYWINPATNQQAGGYTPWPAGDPWVLGTSTVSWAQEGGSRVETRTCFEKATGIPVWSRALRNGSSPQATDTLAFFSRDGAGNLTREAFYGGDPGGVPATDPSPTCALSGLPAPQYELRHQYQFGARSDTEYLTAAGGEALKVLDLEIDARSALAKKSTDPAGIATDFEYDELGRLVWEKPQTGHDAWTEYLHRAATGSGMLQLARTEIRERANGSETGAVRSERWAIFDGLGRLAYDRVKLPGAGWTKVYAAYNAMGRPFLISERHADSVPDGQLGRTRYFDYDPFGRPDRIRPPEGVTHDVTFSYSGVRTVVRTVKIGTGWNGSAVTETAASTTEVYDRQGRLLRVREPAGIGHPAYQAEYGYDAAGRLTGVTMEPQQAGGGPSQSRSFVYDGRGFLTSESHPETAVVYSDHDALGHPRRVREGAVNGPFDLRLVYDRAERVTLIEEAGSGRDLKAFTYATASVAGNWREGKLETAIRHNWINHPDNGNLLDVVVTETYTYGGRGGRPSRRDTALNTGHTFTQSWLYDDLGRVTTLTYPTCTFAACAPANPAGSTVSFGYADGALTSVAGYATAIIYHPNGALHQVQHANGVTLTHGLDPNHVPRPASIALSGGAVGATLAYAYDGAGNVTRVGSEIYLYDALGRVVEGRLGSGTQTYRFDAFGNLTQTQTTPAGGSTTTQTFGVNAATNRLSAAAYDAAGNQLGWGAYGYTYDALSMLERVTGGGNDTTHVYTADDQRIWTVDATTFPWKENFTLRDLDGKVLRTFRTEDEFDGPWQWIEDYVYRDGALLASRRPVEGVRHFHADHLGTPRMITNALGQNAGGFSLYPFGASVAATNAAAERMRFTGHERDLGVSFPAHTDDLDYMHARFYGPMTGRFLSVDPVGGNAGMPASWNRYAYVYDNPVNYTDPTGMLGASMAGVLALQRAIASLTFFDSITVTGNAYDLSGLLRFFFDAPPGFSSGTSALELSYLPATPTTTADSQKPPCDWIDKFYGTIEQGIQALDAVILSGDLMIVPITGIINGGVSANVTANADGSATFYLGGGLVLGPGGARAASPRFGGTAISRTTGSGSGFGVRAAGGLPLASVVGVRGSGFIGTGGTSSSVGLGVVGGPAGSLTLGYSGTLREPSVGEVNPCSFFN